MNSLLLYIDSYSYVSLQTGALVMLAEIALFAFMVWPKKKKEININA